MTDGKYLEGRLPSLLAGRTIERVYACHYAKTGAEYQRTKNGEPEFAFDGLPVMVDVWGPVECAWPTDDWNLPEYVGFEFTDGSCIMVECQCHDESRVDIQFWPSPKEIINAAG